MMLLRILTRLATEQRGATVIEFAIIAPVMCLLLVGAFDVSHTLYLKSALTGIVQKTARDASIEGSSGSDLDKKVKQQVLVLVNNADVSFSRRFYKTFTEAAAAKAEDWTDLNGNGRCDNGEPFIDTNENSVWDRDGGDNGQGSAKDATVYTVTIQYPRMLPLDGFIDVDPNVKVIATTVLRNQPFDAQKSYGAPTSGSC